MPFRDLRDRFLGRGEAAVTVPSMDGALRPNTALDGASVLTEIPVPDNLIDGPDGVLCTSGSQVLTVQRDGSVVPVGTYNGEVTCLAAMPDGRLIAGLSDGRLLLDGKQELRVFGREPSGCPTAIAVMDARTVLVAQGSTKHPPGGWRHDLLQGNRTGSVWRLDVESGEATKLASGLGFPNGLLLANDRRSVVVSEAWRHRLVRLRADAPSEAEPVLAHLPGYPGRLSPAFNGGVWMAVFAPRSQLIEFVLREPTYTRRMMETVEPDYWVAPALRSGDSFKEPLQGGAIKSMGILKPWAPTLSYGLLVRLDPRLVPIRSYHSRADGLWHGVTSALEQDGRILVASKGGGGILELKEKEVAA